MHYSFGVISITIPFLLTHTCIPHPHMYIQVVNEYYRREGTEPAVDQQVEFESDHISLDIPMKGVLTENKGWKILPLTRPVVCMSS